MACADLFETAGLKLMKVSLSDSLIAEAETYSQGNQTFRWGMSFVDHRPCNRRFSFSPDGVPSAVL